MLPFGLDLASVDANTQRDYLKTKASGIRSVIVRGAYGRKAQAIDKTIFLDPLANDMPVIRKAGLRTGSYLFVCVPKKRATTPEPEVQVDTWLDYILPLTVKHQDLPPAIDLEEDSDVLGHAELKAWYDRAARRCHDRLGCWPMFYTSDRYWIEGLGSPPAGIFMKCPPWLAKPWPWNVRTPMQWGDTPSSPKTIPAFGTAWNLYQRQGDATGAPGFNRTTDVNVIRQFGQGAKGEHVKLLQMWLNASGALGGDQTLVVDGIFGAATKYALEQAQTMFKISVDGVFGLQSLCALSWVDLGK